MFLIKKNLKKNPRREEKIKEKREVCEPDVA